MPILFHLQDEKTRGPAPSRWGGAITGVSAVEFQACPECWARRWFLLRRRRNEHSLIGETDTINID
jgi:hypothetical protein